MDYTVDEIMSVCIARQVVDGEVLAQGINTPLVMAGFILAKLTHAPTARFASAIGQGIVQDWSPLSVGRAEDHWLEKGLFHAGFAVAAAELLPKYNPKEFFRPAQVDASGCFNNIAFNRPKLRLPGSGGIPDVTTYSDRIYLYVPRHSPAVFVRKLDYLSGLGHVAGRVRGRGVNYLVSELGQFDWTDEGKMRLTSIHPGASLEQITRKTGFPLERALELTATPPPTAEEIRLLREVIDPLNVRKLETLGGSARKTLLREILACEGTL